MGASQEKRAGEEGERNRKQKSEEEEARAHEDKVDRKCYDVALSRLNRHYYFTVCLASFIVTFPSIDVSVSRE